LGYNFWIQIKLNTLYPNVISYHTIYWNVGLQSESSFNIQFTPSFSNIITAYFIKIYACRCVRIQAHKTANGPGGGGAGGGVGASEEKKNLNASHIARKKYEFS
jgi:hypothetical protein